MGFKDVNAGAASTTFLVLYLILTVFTSNAVFRQGVKSPYTIVLIFGLIRLGAQLSGIGFAVAGYQEYKWLIAYLIMGAEGYFVLLLCVFHFYCYSEEIAFGWSSLRPTRQQRIELSEQKGRSPDYYKYTSWAAIFHFCLIPANVLIIVGGTQLSSLRFDDPALRQAVTHRAQILRGTGQAVFLFLNCVAMALGVYLIKVKNLRTYMMYALLAACPFCFIRGLYGLLSVFILSINYFDMSNYTANGLAPRFVACEYILGTTMEFLAASLIVSTFYFKRPQKNLQVETDCIQLTSKSPDAGL
ncbi:hypothetical protein TRVA0_010S00342 [Trichomonascus vanleenenianus]|uniref:uncharacterized protein n=1 Tax=Trichomonascus vanleenenianus TaxID=2268995 RepID=UPI003ECACA81